MDTRLWMTNSLPTKGLSGRALAGSGVCALVALVAACSAEERPRNTGEGGTSGSAGAAGNGGNGGTAGTAAGSGGVGATGASGGTAGVGGIGGTTGGVGGTGGAAGGTGGTTGGVGGSVGGTGGNTGGVGGTGGGNPCGTVDPNCECAGTRIVGRDADGDGARSRACLATPGTDCDDNDDTFQQNACGGCGRTLAGTPGQACGQCGAWACSGQEAVVCNPPSPAPLRCSGTTRQLCSAGGNWANHATQCSGSSPACLNGNCVQCSPGTYQCIDFGNGDTGVVPCLTNGTWYSSWTVSCFGASGWACSSTVGRCCNSTTGACTGMLIPRDRDLVIPEAPAQAPSAAPSEYAELIPTADVLSLALGLG